MAKKNVCCWCEKIVIEPANYKPYESKLVCSNECLVAERMFCKLYSDKEILMRKSWEAKK